MAEAARLAELVAAAPGRGVAPAVVCLLWRDGRPLLELAAGQADPETVFDLASLTKPLATALLALDLAASGRLPWDTGLGEVLGRAVPAAKRGITILDLLCHRAGFPAHRPYFTRLAAEPPATRRALLLAMLLNEPLAHPPGSRALYSDLGYLLLGLILERAGGEPLDQAVARVHRLLGVTGLGFRRREAPPPWPLARVAPCGPLPGRPLVHGQVEDENAFALGGVAGQAGLFGPARAVAELMAALCRAAGGQGPWPAGLASRLFAVDATTPGSARTPGFDTPQGPLSAAGPRPPAGTVGHLGFTGTSLWWHPAGNRGVVLLSNRVALGRANQAIQPFRRAVHALAWERLAKEPAA